MQKKKFKNLTKPRQRVAIAMDVIEQIHTKRIKVKSSIYLETKRGGWAYLPVKICQACALGALFFAKYRLANGPWPGVMNQRDLQSSLSEYFSAQELDGIEYAFETSWRWTRWFENDEDRLIAIMQNIIDHDGTLESSVEYVMVEVNST